MEAAKEDEEEERSPFVTPIKPFHVTPFYSREALNYSYRDECMSDHPIPPSTPPSAYMRPPRAHVFSPHPGVRRRWSSWWGCVKCSLLEIQYECNILCIVHTFDICVTLSNSISTFSENVLSSQSEVSCCVKQTLRNKFSRQFQLHHFLLYFE